jgi:hypothetical protein
VAEARLLQSLGAKFLDIVSPQFTAHPAKASALLAALFLDSPPLLASLRLFLTSRVDSLAWSLRRHPTTWQHFAQSNSHRIDLGVESFLPSRLLRLGKYRNLKQAQQQKQYFDEILNFFRGSPTRLRLYLMPLDWQMELDEAEQEAQILLRYLDLYPQTIIVHRENIGNRVSYSAGSLFAETMEPLDFLRFQRDPRLFLLSYLVEWLSEKFLQSGEDLKEYALLCEETMTRVLLQSYLRAIALLRSFPPSLVPLERCLSLLSRAEETGEAWELLLGQLPTRAAKKLQKFLRQESRKASKRFVRERDDLLSRKALVKMEQQGKISNEKLRSLLLSSSRG